jgi:hypothetical protein
VHSLNIQLFMSADLQPFRLRKAESEFGGKRSSQKKKELDLTNQGV